MNSSGNGGGWTARVRSARNMARARHGDRSPRARRSPRGVLRIVRDAFLESVFPAFCPVCSEPLPGTSPGGVCLACWASVRPLLRPYCAVCCLPFPPPTPATLSVVPETPHAPVTPDPPHPAQHEDRPCEDCLAQPPPFALARAVTPYEGRARELVHAFKFGDRPEIAGPLGRMMSAAWAGEILSGRRTELVVAVPQRLWKERRRGFNPAAVLAGTVARALGVPLRRRALRKARRTHDQASLASAAARRANPAGAFRVRRLAEPFVECRGVLLVDDILTTGATASECARALLAAGAREVGVLVFARTPRLRQAPGGQAPAEQATGSS